VLRHGAEFSRFRGNAVIDIAMGYELVEEWLPDFIAVAENPTHVNAEALREQARARVIDSYRAVTEYDDHKLNDVAQIDYACDDVLVILEAVAEWIVEKRRPHDSRSGQ
jgi:hypothetical protein